MLNKLFINRNFALLFFGRLVSDIGLFFYNFAIGWYILSLTESASQTGFYLAFGGIVYFIFIPLAGVLADRLDKVKIFYITDIIRGFTILIAGLIIIQTTPITIGNYIIDITSLNAKLITLYVTTFILSVNNALFTPAVGASIPYLVEQHQLQKANALTHAHSSLVSIIGALLGGIIYTVLGINFIFFFTGGAYLISAISEMFIKAVTKASHDDQFTLKGAFIDIKEGFKYLWLNKGLVTFIFIALLANLFANPIFTVANPYIFNQILQTEPIYYSVVGISLSVGSIIMAIVLARLSQPDKIHPFFRKGLLIFTIVIIFQTTFLVLLLPAIIDFVIYYIAIILLSFILGGTLAYINTPINVAIHRHVERSMLGRVSSIMSIITTGLLPITTAIGGIIIDYGSITILMIIATGGLIGVTIVTYLSKRITLF
jgi:MFS transporter, DHA3 family, macrolide efflux protein